MPVQEQGEAGAEVSDSPTALRHLPAHALFWGVTGTLLGIDLWSKAGVFEALSSTEVRTVIPGLIEFHCSLNDGAVFGSFTGQTGLFVVASIFALGFVFYLFAHSGPSQRSLHIALALILSGAFGNLYDRAFIKADVVIPAGTGRRIIGKIVSHPDDATVRVGDWPRGNHARTFDRDKITIRRQGVVRDFIKFVPRFPASFPKVGGNEMWPWVFNVADAALVCGVSVLLLNTWWVRKPRTRPE